MGRGTQNSTICNSNLRHRSTTSSVIKKKENDDTDNNKDDITTIINNNNNNNEQNKKTLMIQKKTIHQKSETTFKKYYHNNEKSQIPDVYYQLSYDYLCEKAKAYGIFLYYNINGEKIQQAKNLQHSNSNSNSKPSSALNDDDNDNDDDDIYSLAEKRCNNATREQLLIGLLPYARILVQAVETIDNGNNNNNNNNDRIIPNCLPLHPPHFTLTDIKKSIPRHLFERSFMKSMSHLLLDFLYLFMILFFGIYYLQPFVEYINNCFVLCMTQIIVSLSPHVMNIIGENSEENIFLMMMMMMKQKLENQEYSLFIIKAIVWCSYWMIQGTVMTGIWVMAHECGHQAFSTHAWINNTVGLILHSFLLVPYHSWRISHGKHHNNTGSCDNDEVFNPYTKSDFNAKELILETPFMTAVNLILMLTIGWMPGYLLLNKTGPKKYRDSPIMKRNHFMPNSILFNYDQDFYDIIISDMGFFIALYLIFFKGIQWYGLSNIICYYVIPYMITNFWLVLITFLQHTDVFIPHFRGKEWNWLRGALCTCDRSFGFILNHMLHHITDTHVCHHLFSKIPFYNAEEATKHMKPILGPYYLNDKNSSIIRATWRAFRYCNYIDNQYDDDLDNDNDNDTNADDFDSNNNNNNNKGRNDIVFYKSEIHLKK